MSPRRLSRILVVDDDPDMLAVVALALRTLGGYSVETCDSAADAAQAAERSSPDLVLMDITMPGLDGFGVLGAMREVAGTRRTPVVFMSALRLPLLDLAKYDGLGFLGVIPKPFDPAALPETLEVLWGSHAQRRTEAHHKEFESLRRIYIAELGEKVEAMQVAAANLAAAGWDRPVIESLRHLAHRIAGSAGLYRLAALSRSAGALEEILCRLLNSPTWPPSSSPAELARLVKAVGRAARDESQMSEASGPAARRSLDRAPTTASAAPSPSRTGSSS